MSEIVPDHIHRGGFVVRNGRTEQSWVDPRDPLRLEFEYVQRIAEVLDETVLARPEHERVRIVHVGGGGLTIPRYVEARRPRTAQVVLEPDADLTEQVRLRLPLPRHSGIKVRPVDGRSGVAALPSGCADAVVVDAFAGASVPGELATTEFFTELTRVLREDGLTVMNLTDQAPFNWSRRCLAGLVGTHPQVALSAEVPLWRGRRFGNLVAVAGADLPLPAFARRLARAPFPYRLVAGRDLTAWIAGGRPFTDEDAEPSLAPSWSRGWFS